MSSTWTPTAIQNYGLRKGEERRLGIKKEDYNNSSNGMHFLKDEGG
jgi:hypothetical protein